LQSARRSTLETDSAVSNPQFATRDPQSASSISIRIRNPKSEIRNSKSEIRNPKSEIRLRLRLRNPTRNLQSAIRIPKFAIRDPQPVPWPQKKPRRSIAFSGGSTPSTP
jgi:hypothetical protein